MRRDAITVHDQVAHPPQRTLVTDEAKEANNSSSKQVVQCENGCAHYILNLSKQLPLQMIATIQSLNTCNVQHQFKPSTQIAMEIVAEFQGDVMCKG
jgi:hypothetical protein